MASQKDPELKSLMDKFVCVRIVQMGGVDLRVYQFDPLLSWAVMFMYGDKTIYGRYGSASPQAKRSKTDSNPNHTLAGLKAALRAALALHEAHLRNPAFEAVLQKKSGFALPWRYVEETPVAKLHRRLGRGRDVGQVRVRGYGSM